MDPTPDKISETLLHYIDPPLEVIGDEPERDELESIISVATTVWNACVLDAVDGSQGYVAQIRESTVNDPGTQSLMDFLIERKHSEFADDHRLITDPEVTWKNGQWHIHAVARRRSSE